jgi:uncharacterized protein YecE (DUF72 family)
MDYGRVNDDELDSIDFSLPKDHPQTTKVLAANKGSKTEVWVGCAKWGRPEWVGKIYAKGTKPANFLDEYAKQYKCIELNAISYQLPTKEQLDSWISKVGSDFLFCPKFSDTITHRKRLKNVDRELESYFKAINDLGSHLGPIFLLPHPQMGPKQMDTIVEFIKMVPKEINLFVEFRHPEWYTQPHFDTMFSILEDMKKGTVITDTAARRDGVHMRLTTPEAFIRFVGNSLHESDYSRIDEWVKRIKQWMKQGLKTCYFFMHMHDERYSPELSKYLVEQLNSQCGLSIPVPKFVENAKLL